MKSYYFLLLLTIFSWNAFAIPCDCEVVIYHPMSGSRKIEPNTLKTYELEEYSSYSLKNKYKCRDSCLETFKGDMSNDRLIALLMTYSERLIQSRKLGYNCTGPTTLKYPVRVKAILGRRGLGNVSDFIQVVHHEERCF